MAETAAIQEPSVQTEDQELQNLEIELEQIKAQAKELGLLSAEEGDEDGDSLDSEDSGTAQTQNESEVSEEVDPETTQNDNSEAGENDDSDEDEISKDEDKEDDKDELDRKNQLYNSIYGVQHQSYTPWRRGFTQTTHAAPTPQYSVKPYTCFYSSTVVFQWWGPGPRPPMSTTTPGKESGWPARGRLPPLTPTFSKSSNNNPSLITPLETDLEASLANVSILEEFLGDRTEGQEVGKAQGLAVVRAVGLAVGQEVGQAVGLAVGQEADQAVEDARKGKYEGKEEEGAFEEESET